MIKFRGKRVDNGEWVYFNHFGIYCDNEGNELQPKRFIRDCGYKVDPSTVGMGVEIDGKWYFDGDIAKCLNTNDEWYISEIKFDGSALIIDVQRYDYDYTAIGWALENDIQEIKIIGNKWDNPELLGGQNEQGN